MEVEINRVLLQSFIAYNRSYDEIKEKYPDIDNEANFGELGDALELLALEELIKGYPEAEANRDLAKDIMFDIIDAEPLKELTSEQLAIEFLNYFAGEFESRTS